MSETQDHARKAGRGFLSIAGAKIYFILTGFIVQFSLPRLFGAPEVFGLFSIAMSSISILDNMLIAATIQSVSKFVSEDEARAPTMLRQGLALQGALGLTLFGAIVFGAGPLAAFNQNASLAPLLRIAAFVPLSYAVYAVLIGCLNGRHDFARQAKFDVTFTTLRTVGILGGAALGFGALGAISGFAAAAVAITVLALVGVGTGKGGDGAPAKAWIAFMAPIWAYQGFLNGMLQIDTSVVVPKTIAELAVASGLDAAAAAREAERLVGFYRGAQTFAFVPYQLVLATTFIVFPTVSRATALGDEDAARSAVRGSLRFSTLLLLSMAAPIAGAAEGLLAFAYGPAYAAGAPALRVLAFGLVAFTLFVISATAMGGSGRPAVSAGVAALGMGVAVVACRLLLKAFGRGEHALAMAGAGTSIGMVVAMGAAGIAVYRRFGTFVPVATALRGGLAAVAGYAASFGVFPHDVLWGRLLSPVLGFAAFVVVLTLTREIGAEELALVRRVVGRRPAAASAA